MRNRRLLGVLLLTLPLLGGADIDNTIHPQRNWLYTHIEPGKGEEISKKYGYFSEVKLPNSYEGGGASGWTFQLRFNSATNQRTQVRLYYGFGGNPGFIDRNNYPYMEVYSGPYTRVTAGKFMDYSLKVGKVFDNNNNVKVDDRYRVWNGCFALGIYVDEHGPDTKGRFIYFTFPSPYASGKRYHLSPSGSSDYMLYGFGPNGEEERHRGVKIGGYQWKVTVSGVDRGIFDDWRDFKQESRGEIKTELLPIPLKMTLENSRGKYTTLPIKENDANLFIYDGYEAFDFGRVEKGYDGKKGYRVPLKVNFDGTSVTLSVKDNYYTTHDGHHVYRKSTLPGNVSDYRCLPGLPLPALSSKTPKTFVFQIELLNCGAASLVDITARFSYTKSKNVFGHYNNSTFHVEEVEG